MALLTLHLCGHEKTTVLWLADSQVRAQTCIVQLTVWTKYLDAVTAGACSTSRLSLPEQTQKSSRNKFCHEWSLWSQTSSFKQMEAWSKICEIQDLQKKKNHHFRAHLSYVAHMSVYIRPLGIHGNSMFLRCLCFQSHEVILVVSWGAEGRKEMWLVRVFSLSNMQECRVSS